MKTVKKNKKLFIIIAIAVIILALGLFTSLFSKSTQIFSTVDECNVTIKYVIDGEDKPFKVYSQVHEKGEEINIKSPVKEGYSPDQEKIVALVKSDMIFIVKYKCSHFSNFINDPI